MPLNFAFALSQQQTFELRCDYGSRRLDKTELAALIDLCEQNYYAQQRDRLPYLTQLGRQLYQWLDGKEGWLRKSLDEADEQTIYLDLIQTSEAQGLNPETERVALGLAHLPWELLHDGAGFLIERQNLSVLPVRSVQQRQTQVIGVQNRPLRLLFMATSPEDPRVPPLGFEQEEANILQATKDQPLALIVEESGSVAELANLVKSYPEDYFDVFHLTGHGIIYTQQGYGSLLPKSVTLADNTPCFITEDEVGNMQLTTVNDLARAFHGRWPRVTFLSGCHTGQVPNKGTVPSMAQALVKAGAGIVLGWARPVYDRTGIVAAQALYQALATGATVEEAVKAAQQEMIDKECTDWYLLRMYRDTRPIAELVTPLRTKNREKLKFTAPEQEFLDENNLVKVASRFEFVGRRRPLQRCLRALRETSDQIGVFIAGMGGLGKSTLAARLCTRVQTQRDNFARVVLIGPLDEWGLLNKLSNKFERFADVPALLNEPKVSLKGRLQNFFAAIEKEHNQPLLLVLDDFEQNIPTANIEDGSLWMTADAYEILGAICAALAENGGESRLIVTCRYLKSDTLPPHRLHLEHLEQMSSSDIDKICFPLDKEVRQQLRTQQIIHIADGNPRLLKWLLEVIQQPGLAADELLNRLEETEQKFREDILAQTLLDALEPEEQKFLARLSVFHLPVTEEIVRAISTAGGLAVLGKLTSLSLVESAITHPNQPANYRVTTILEPLLEPLLSEEEWQATRQQAVRKIHQVWWGESEQKTEAEALEIVRLGLLAKEQEIAVSIGEKIATFWSNTYRYVEVVQLCSQILQNFSDYRILASIAPAEFVLGSAENALSHYQKALDCCPEEDEIRKATIFHNTAGLMAQQGEIHGALQFWQESLKIKECIGDSEGKALTLNDMARVIAQQGDIHKALQLSRQALEIEERTGNLQGKANVLHQIARVLAQQSDISQALQLWQESLEIKDKIGDALGRAATLHQMARVIAQQGDIPQALQLWQESLEIDEGIGNAQGIAATLNDMGQVIAQQGDIPQALKLWQQALEISERIGSAQDQASALSGIGCVLFQEGDIPQALNLWQQALAINDHIGDARAKAYILNNMGQATLKQGDIPQALNLWQQALTISEHIGDARGKGFTLNNMACTAFEQGEIYRGSKLLELSARALGESKAYVDLVKVLINLGVASASKCLLYLTQATWLCLRLQSPLSKPIVPIIALYNAVPQGDELQALLGATAMFLCNYRDEGHPQLEELQQHSLRMISEAAGRQGVKTQEAFDAWVFQQRLNDPEYFLPRLNQRLEEIVGDGWLFDPSQVSMGE
ncbi:tetratricopeptide repeat protein [Nostoc sp. DedQUE09]|uniref:tetratricopeptide repeat protein n=1 Tax=Nostoc sp. DedQUE09 TaxID=3075394 RepID=UPI002AD32FB8|nr:tetratricopeptide repeat protein [Nostoc sp. DedQUE09]MDZ7950051.1 tetratricopeptide repeat protein [Nostoc sp. DedQUE09]